MTGWAGRALAGPYDLVRLTCEQATRVASARLDGPIPLAQRLRLAIHLAICRWCRRYARQIAFLRRVAAAASEAPAADTAPRLPEDARARIKAALKTQ
jgi:predicted anti-sigma-YlaC factor YlaD